MDVLAWAASAGVRVTTARDWPHGDFRTDPRIDFGRVITRTPQLVLHPRDSGELATCMRVLGREGIAFTTRAAAHSAGGQVLSDGVVVDLRGLDRIVADDPAAQTITAGAGAWWLALADHLALARRRPLVLTDNTRSTLGGTLAVGGFGDSTHRHGLQAERVRALTVITVDGERHVVHPGDPLFDYVLCGRGQLAVIAEATIETVARSSLLVGRVLRWRSFTRFVDSALRILEHGAFDFFRARVRWEPDHPVYALAGDLDTATTPLDRVRPDEATALEQLDLHQHASIDPHARWRFVAPALELVFPLDAGLAAWERLAARVEAAGLATYMPRGTSVMVLGPSRLPLAPFPPAERVLLVALRLELTAADAPRVVDELRAIGRAALDDGARLYLMSLEPDVPDFLERQFGDALPMLRALKDRHDPRRLLNPWRL